MSTGGCFLPPRQRFAIKVCLSPFLGFLAYQSYFLVLISILFFQVARKSARPPPIGDVKKQRLHRCHSGTTGVFSADDDDDDDDESSSGDLDVNDGGSYEGESSSEELSADDDEGSSALGSASPHCSPSQLASQVYAHLLIFFCVCVFLQSSVTMANEELT